MKAWPFRSRITKAAFVFSIAIMIAAAVFGLVAAFIEREFGATSLRALTVGMGAVLIAVSLIVSESMTRKFHPESGLFMWTDVDRLRELSSRSAVDAPTREWARSLADRIAIVLPGRPPTDQFQ